MTVPPSTAPADTYERLAERFRPLFAEIAAGAADREISRTLPFEQIRLLRDAGFGAVRVPEEYGGAGASAVELFRLLIELARADSNVAHIWRGHFAFLEVRLAHEDPDYRRHWGEQAVAGVVVGNAQSESATASPAESNTVLTEREDGTLLLNGEKYYSTGTIFSDWANVTARYQDEHATIAVPLDADGVTVHDDWTGFGQRLTGTGTTTFSDVVVDPAHLTVYSPGTRDTSYISGFYQLFLLAVVAGIGHAAVDDAANYVRSRTRSLITGAAAQDDPLSQAVLGRAAGAAFAAEAAVLHAAQRIDDAHRAKLDGVTEKAPYEATDVAAYSAQVVVIPLVLSLTTAVFDVGGSSSVAQSRVLDRHWRNARTVGVHNPIAARERAVGHQVLFGELPDFHAEHDARKAEADATVDAEADATASVGSTGIESAVAE